MTPLDRLVARKLIDEHTARGLLEHRASLDPLQLVAAVEQQVAAILAMPPGRCPKARNRGPRAQFVSKIGEQMNVRFEDAPVRSYVAR